MIHFITGNKNKFAEVKMVLPNIQQLDIDLLEIQDLDAHKIIKAKLDEALKYRKGELIVEDTSLYLNCLPGLPGPFIKWFLKAIGNSGLVSLTEKLGNNKAEARTIIGYAKSANNIHYFEGKLMGQIVKPRMKSAFGWDPIFLPKGKLKTFAEMDRAEKNSISMRSIAVKKLQLFLKKNRMN